VAAMVADRTEPTPVVSTAATITDQDLGGDVAGLANSAPEPPLAVAPVGRRRRVRRTVSRRARTVAASVLGRAERWLRAGELEADRL
jgi:hypothetical protein